MGKEKDERGRKREINAKREKMQKIKKIKALMLHRE
jgi:hypothetical protein